MGGKTQRPPGPRRLPPTTHPLLKCSLRTKPLVFAAACFTAAALAQDCRITTGPVDNQCSNATPTKPPTCGWPGRPSTRNRIAKRSKLALSALTTTLCPGFDWASIGKVQKLKWSGDVKRVPAGGPYRLEVRLQGAESTISIANLLVGDLWVLAGQSNMEGLGELIEVQQPSPQVHGFDMADRWGVAEEPLHTLVNAADPVHWPLNAQRQPERLTGERLETFVVSRKKGAGLGLPFAVEMVQRTGIPIGLIPCAHGGTSMDQWSPALKNREGESLYGSMYRRVQAVGGQVKGVLWYQGESDANPTAAPQFLAKFEAFVKAMRSDFNQPDLPFYYVQIGRHIDKTNFAEWNKVQERISAPKPTSHARAWWPRWICNWTMGSMSARRI